MKRLVGLCLISLLAIGTAAAANGEQFISIYGGYSKNDEKTGAEDSIPYGIRWGAETPVAGGQISVELNRDGGIKMDTMLFSIIFNFASKDSRTSNGRIIFNRASGFVTGGVGGMRYESDGDPDLILAWEAGIGTQVKFSRVVGLRIQVNAIATGAHSFLNYEATMGLGFYF